MPSPAADDAPIDPAVMELGKAKFLVCGRLPWPEWRRRPDRPAACQFRMGDRPGFQPHPHPTPRPQGPITVAGKEYNFPGGMAPMAYQTDEQIAAVLTYIRNSFGNKAPP
jgi:hypothetical protein